MLPGRPLPTGTPLGNGSIHAVQLTSSPDMHSLSIVLSDGRAAFLTSRSARYEPQDVTAVWIPGLTGATCTALNGRYRLVAFGKEEWAMQLLELSPFVIIRTCLVSPCNLNKGCLVILTRVYQLLKTLLVLYTNKNFFFIFLSQWTGVNSYMQCIHTQ